MDQSKVRKQSISLLEITQAKELMLKVICQAILLQILEADQIEDS